MGIKLKVARGSSAERVRKFRWITENHDKFPIDVTMRYIPPASLQEQADREKTRVLSRYRSVELQDQQQELRELQAAFYAMLARMVVKVEGFDADNQQVDGLTFRVLSSLIPLDAKDIADGGGMKAVVGMDEENVRLLIEHCAGFAKFIQDVCTDVSMFQDKTFEDEVKNFETGANSSSRQAPQDQAAAPALNAPKTTE